MGAGAVGGKGGPGQHHGHWHPGKGQFVYLINSLHLPHGCLSPMLQPGMAAPGNKPVGSVLTQGGQSWPGALGTFLLVLCMLTGPCVHTQPCVIPPVPARSLCSVCAPSCPLTRTFCSLSLPLGFLFKAAAVPPQGPATALPSPGGAVTLTLVSGHCQGRAEAPRCPAGAEAGAGGVSK